MDQFFVRVKDNHVTDAFLRILVSLNSLLHRAREVVRVNAPVLNNASFSANQNIEFVNGKQESWLSATSKFAFRVFTLCFHVNHEEVDQVVIVI